MAVSPVIVPHYDEACVWVEPGLEFSWNRLLQIAPALMGNDTVTSARRQKVR